MTLVRITRSCGDREAQTQKIALAQTLARQKGLSGPSFRSLLNKLTRNSFEKYSIEELLSK